MFGRVPGTRPNISESHIEISTRVPFCIAGQGQTTGRGSIEVGVVSWGYGDSPNVYARVSAYRVWIAETIAVSERRRQLSA